MSRTTTQILPFLKFEPPKKMKKGYVVDQNEVKDNFEHKIIIIYRRNNQNELDYQAEFDLSGVEGYFTFAKKAQGAYNGHLVTAVSIAVPHVLWPGWPDYHNIQYFSGDGELLNPLMLPFEQFQRVFAYAVVTPTELLYENAAAARVIYLTKHTSTNVDKVMHIPANQVTSFKPLDHIIYLYQSSYVGLEPYDNGILPLDNWPMCETFYKDAQGLPLERAEVPYVEPFEHISEADQISLQRLLDGGEADDGGEAGDADEEDHDEEEQEESESEEWVAFLRKLKHIDVYPILHYVRIGNVG